ncbi:ABC transporter substrate-binding protein [uncultured Castellaniella sp.]|uniref:ABC transporter substrate-binding protein n=1 Tax=uncultured Castellaniella sp. TaxID=647907 RepID=UPI00261D4CD0|nr:ABC transporter substrate-binding protein [uncultured Castellaniella sp.]
MKKLRFLSALLISATLGFGALAAPAAAQDAKLKEITVLTNYTFHGRHTPFFVGLEKGFYRDAGFDAKIMPAAGSGFVISAIESGKADYGMADAGPVVQAVAKGAKVKGFLVFMDKTTMGFASLEPYPDPASIKGKKVAASQADSARVIFPIILGRNNLADMPVDWQTADSGVYSSLLLSGRVDLFTASIDGDVPALQKLAAPRGKKVYFSSFADWGYDVYGYWMIASQAKLKDDPAEVRRFADATSKAVQYSIEHPEEAARIMVKHNTTLNYDTVLSQWGQSVKAIDTDYTKKNGYGVATDDRIENTIGIIGEALKLKTDGIKPGDVFQHVVSKP